MLLLFINKKSASLTWDKISSNKVELNKMDWLYLTDPTICINIRTILVLILVHPCGAVRDKT